MQSTITFTWKHFRETLSANQELDLEFQYTEGKFIDASYHITEVKQAPITAVDCGGVMSGWTEIIVQLYEPDNQQQIRAMKAKKALSIFDVVEKVLPLNPNGIVKIEFGNTEFATRQMLPKSIIRHNEKLVVDLRPDTVQCKAIDRGGSCGTPAVKTPVQLQNLTVAQNCTPGGGCC